MRLEERSKTRYVRDGEILTYGPTRIELRASGEAPDGNGDAAAAESAEAPPEGEAAPQPATEKRPQPASDQASAPASDEESASPADQGAKWYETST